MHAPSTANKDCWPPDYVSAFKWRQAQARAMRRNPALLIGAKEFYRTRPVEFINHWVTTYDPRVQNTDLPTKLPFILFERQAEMVRFIAACLEAEESGLIEKTRDMGATWACVAISVWLWLFRPGAVIGWGSYLEKLVDKIGDPKSVFEKIRLTIGDLPKMFLPAGFSPSVHSNFMRVINPENGAVITGEVGDNMGRGGRSLIYFKDEASHYEHPEKIEAALGDNTRVQIDISSVNGLGNVFHRKREAGVDWTGGAIAKGRVNVFVLDWRDHPEKTEEWYQSRRKKAELDGLLREFAQEVDRDYSSSVEGVVIPSAWVKSSIDADKKLGIKNMDEGGWCAALDVADEGGDTNALAKRKGSVLKSVEEWGERDTGLTTRRAVAACEGIGRVQLQYDSIGVGAGVKAESNRLADEGLLKEGIRLIPWNAGAEVLKPDGRVIPWDNDSPLNKDFYANMKAQAWWEARRRFENTHRAITDPNFTWNVDDLICIPSDLPLLRKIEKELSQATMGRSARMKLLINKTPEGTKSPNLADAIVMAFWPCSGGYDTSYLWL